MIYIVVLLLMLIGVYAYDYRGYRRSYNLSYWAFFVILVLIAGLRFRIGTDSIVYESYYENVPPVWELFSFNFDSTRFEPGFLVFASIPRSFSSDFMWLQFMESIVINLVVFWFILKNTPHRFLCLLLYYVILYFNLNMQVMREALAVAAFLLAWPFFRDGKWVWYYCLAFISFAMHTSAAFLLIIPLFCLPGVKQLFFIGKRSILMCVLLFALGVFVQTRFTSIFSLMAVTERMLDRVNEYSHHEMGKNVLNLTGVLGVLVQYCVYPLVALYFLGKGRKYEASKEIHREKEEEDEPDETEESKRIKAENRKYERWQIMVMLGVYLMVFSIPIFIFRRYFNYFGMFSLATIATWTFSKLMVRPGKRVRLGFAQWILILLPWFLLTSSYYNGWANKSGTLKTYQIYYPYSSRFDPETDSDREAIYHYWGAR